MSFTAAVNPAAPETHEAPATPQCVTYEDLSRLDYPLTRTQRDLAAGKPIKIIAVGSSSTAGAGATSPDKTYPAQLETKLRARFPHAAVSVMNRGQNGIDVKEMLDRIETSILEEKPQLVLLQMGTNTVLRDEDLLKAEELMKQMLNRLRVLDIDVVLIDQQFAPKVNEKKHSQAMLDILQALSHEYGIPVYRRHEQMKRWVDREAITFNISIHPDRLHMSNWGYGCFAEGVAQAVDRSIRMPPAVALRLRGQ